MPDDVIDVKAEGRKVIRRQQDEMRKTGRDADRVMANNRRYRDYLNAQYERADRENKGLQGPKYWGPEAARTGRFPGAPRKRKGKSPRRPQAQVRR